MAKDMESAVDVNIKMPLELKKRFEAFCGDAGMSVQEALCALAEKAVREGAICFEGEEDEPNAETLAAIEDVRKGKNLLGPFYSVEEMMESLNADD